jgi:hypothetical protein
MVALKTRPRRRRRHGMGTHQVHSPDGAGSQQSLGTADLRICEYRGCRNGDYSIRFADLCDLASLMKGDRKRLLGVEGLPRFGEREIDLTVKGAWGQIDNNIDGPV